MKWIYSLLLISISTNSFCQNGKIIGHLIKSDATIQLNYLTIFINQNGKTITDTISDKTGTFFFFNLENGNYSLVIKQIGFRDAIYDSLKITNDTTINLSLNYPPPCKYYEKHPKCIDGHTDHIIPIVYGLPNEKTMKRAKQGKIHLGGCMVSDCDPHFYCTIHKKEL